MYQTIKALVLRVTDYNDRDALLTLLTAEHGLITAKARGLRRKNSPLTAPCQLLSYGEFTLFEYRDQYTINEAHALELFQSLRRDLQRLSLGTYFAQVAQVISQEDQPGGEVLSLVLNCLHGLSALQLPENQVKAVFEFRCACIAGFMPELQGCGICGNPQPDRFDISHGHLLCGTCRSQEENGLRMPVNPGMLDALRYIAYCPGNKLFSFTLSEENMAALSTLTEAYLAAQLERGFSSLDFYKSLFISYI